MRPGAAPPCNLAIGAEAAELIYNDGWYCLLLTAYESRILRSSPSGSSTIRQ